MPIYTGTGDDGSTGLFGNERVPKDHLRIRAYGTVDELNAVLGLARTEPLPADLDRRLSRIQDMLFELGADLARPDRTQVPHVEAATREIEAWIDESEAELPSLHSFILPGGHREAAILHLARTTARRAERLVWSLSRQDQSVPKALGIYLNRLSDLFFSWARLCNQRHGVADRLWHKSGGEDQG
ncbi:MAG: cob(I)yrinic acid a,c-diamide adenosyltransferase [Planctomycetota bacterium]|jgi:cob(I)alamin adenosyltransferase